MTTDGLQGHVPSAAPDGSGPAPDGPQIDEYRILREIPTPGGTAYVAHDTLLDRVVELHVLRGDHDADRPRPTELLRPLQALARSQHPGLQRVHRIFDSPDAAYVVTEYVRGTRLAATGALGERRALEVARSLASALAALHRAGLCHGHLDPATIVVGDDDEVRLTGLDWRRSLADSSTSGLAAGIEALEGAAQQGQRDDLRALVQLIRQLLEPLSGARADQLRASLPGATSADQVLALLGKEATGRSEEPDDLGRAGNPYRGLQAFQAEHRTFFFGRRADVDEMLDRLRHQPWLVVAGRSGTGKSSLIRAGVGPAVADGALGERPQWRVVSLVPGRRPLTALTTALGDLPGLPPEELRAQLSSDPDALHRQLRQRTTGLLLVIDQLEELFTLSEAAEKGLFLEVLSRFAQLSPGVRLVATVRNDFLGQLGAVGEAGRQLLQATVVLAPMNQEGLREAITGPARLCGFDFESSTVVTELVDEARARDGGLPLLSFLLAELWENRDPDRRLIPAAAVARLGGAGGALSRHAEQLYAGLPTDQKQAARRLLLALVTTAGSRARLRESELLAQSRRRADREALGALVRGRLVVAGEEEQEATETAAGPPRTTYELTHETLVLSWPRLASWLEEASDTRREQQRLAAAAREWDRLGRGAEGLWNARQLLALELPGVLDRAPPSPTRRDDERPPPVELFVQESRRAVRRQERRRLAMRLAVPAAILLVLGASAAVLGWRERHQREAVVAEQLRIAERHLAEAEATESQAEQARREALALFDQDQGPPAEERWTEARRLVTRTLARYADASSAVDLARSRHPRHPLAVQRHRELSLRWFLLAERDGNRPLAAELLARLLAGPADARTARLLAPAELRVTSHPAGAELLVRPVVTDAQGRMSEGPPSPLPGGQPARLPAGSYVVQGRLAGHFPTRLPLMLARGDRPLVHLVLPPARSVPAGFVFVPPGWGLIGAGEGEPIRKALHTQPEHPVFVDGFLIGRHEVSHREYLDFLGALTAAEREDRRPRAGDQAVTYSAAGAAGLDVKGHRLEPGQPLCRPRRSVRACQTWTELPVTGVRHADALAYTAWLSSSGRVPGARLCTGREWERAGRGADGRQFPRGQQLAAPDANHRDTYRNDGEQLGADAVGSYPGDVSPFGVHDLAGNVREWVADLPRGPGAPVRAVRGGSWNGPAFPPARLSNRGAGPDARYPMVGIRVCATPRHPPAPPGSP